MGLTSPPPKFFVGGAHQIFSNNKNNIDTKKNDNNDNKKENDKKNEIAEASNENGSQTGIVNIDNNNNNEEGKGISKVDTIFQKLFEVRQLEQPTTKMQLNEDFDIEGTEYSIEKNNEISQQDSKKTKKAAWGHDNYRHIEYNKEMLQIFHELLKFKRVDFNIRLPLANKLTAHVFPINKIILSMPIPWIPNYPEAVEECRKCVEFCCFLILIQALEGFEMK